MPNTSTPSIQMQDQVLTYLKRNWEKTITNHQSEVERLIKKIEICDKWQNHFQNNEATKDLFPELWMDGYHSQSLAYMGLYRYANMLLRSMLETALRIIYFSQHPVEYALWKKDSKWYSGLQYDDVWGKGYQYFEWLEAFQKYKREYGKRKSIIEGKTGIKGLYGALSRSIHTSASTFQTSPQSVSPRYDKRKFIKWAGYCDQALTLINLFFILGFPEIYKSMNSHEKQQILSSGITPDYKPIIESFYP